MNAAKMVLLTAIGLGTAATIGCNEPPVSSTEESIEQASSAIFSGSDPAAGGSSTSGTGDGPFADCPNLPSFGACGPGTISQCGMGERGIAHAIQIAIWDRKAGVNVSDERLLEIAGGRSCAVAELRAFIDMFASNPTSSPTMKSACNTPVVAYSEHITSCQAYATYKKTIKNFRDNPYLHIEFATEYGANVGGGYSGSVFIDPVQPYFPSGASSSSASVPATEFAGGPSIPGGVAYIPLGRAPGTRWQLAGIYSGKPCVTVAFVAGTRATACQTGAATLWSGSTTEYFCKLPTSVNGVTCS